MSPHPDNLPAIEIRLAEPDDESALRRLAALDSAPALRGPVLVAGVDGELLAALALHGGRTIADPFHPTADLVELLRVRAHLIGVRGRAPSAAGAATYWGRERGLSMARRRA